MKVCVLQPRYSFKTEDAEVCFEGLCELLAQCDDTMDLIVLEYDYETIALLANANLFYMITTYICFVLVAVNAGLFVFSFAIQIFKNWRTVKKATKKGVESFVFVGGTDQNFAFAKSVTAKGGRAIVLADLSKCDKESLCEQNVPYSAFGDNDDLLKKLTKLYGQFSDKKVNVVINTGDDKQNLLLAGQVTGICTSCGTEFLAEEKTGANVYVYGEKANTVVYEHLVSDTCGCIRFVNPNKIVAMDFVDKYPLTKFMTDEQVDFDTSLVKDDVKINVAFVGFGKTSQSLFDLFATASQLMTKQNGKVVAKKVSYHIYDGNDPKQNANLQHNYFALQNKTTGTQAKNIFQCHKFLLTTIFMTLVQTATSFTRVCRKTLLQTRYTTTLSLPVATTL